MDGYYKEIIQQMAKSNYKPDVVIGLLRGGGDFAVKLSHYFDIPCEVLTWQTRDGEHNVPKIDFSARQISRIDNEQWFVFPCENWWLY